MTKRVKYTVIWKKSIKIVKESKASFFLHCAQCFAYPSPFSILFPSSIFLFRSPQFIIFPPQCFYSLLHNFIIFPPQCFLFPSSTSTFTSISSFLLFSLHHNHRHISILFPPPSPPPPPPLPPHFYCFPSKKTKGQNQTITFEFGLMGRLFEGKQ